MNEMENDVLFLQEKLKVLGEPELPASLTAEALFRRLDEGTLALGEENEAEGGPARRRVIPWGRIARRGLPLAACLALVVLLYRGGNLAENTAAPMSAGAASSSAAPQMAAEQAPQPELFRSAPGGMEEEAENSAAMDQNDGEPGAAQYAAAPPPQEKNVETADSAAGEVAESAPANDKPNPATGGGGSLTEAEKESIARDQALETQMLTLAAKVAPGENLTPVLAWWEVPEDGVMRSKVVYQNGAEETVSVVIITFAVAGEEETPVLEFLSAEQEEQPERRSPDEPLPDSMESDPGTGE